MHALKTVCKYMCVIFCASVCEHTTDDHTSQALVPGRMHVWMSVGTVVHISDSVNVGVYVSQ